MTAADGTRTQRSQRPDGSLTSAPAVRGLMSDTAVAIHRARRRRSRRGRRFRDRELIIQGERRYTYADIVERSNRLAAYLHSRGLGCHTERSALDGHEVGQDLLGLYAYNGNEFVEALLGAFAARVAPFNVNFRYVKSELQYLLADSGATALIYHACVRAAGSRSIAGSSAAASPDSDRRRLGQRVALRRRGLRERHPIRTAASRRTALARRPVRPLHRRHDRDAERRAVAPARHLHDVVRRAKSDDRRARQLARRDHARGWPASIRAPS